MLMQLLDDSLPFSDRTYKNAEKWIGLFGIY